VIEMARGPGTWSAGSRIEGARRGVEGGGIGGIRDEENQAWGMGTRWGGRGGGLVQGGRGGTSEGPSFRDPAHRLRGKVVCRKGGQEIHTDRTLDPAILLPERIRVGVSAGISCPHIRWRWTQLDPSCHGGTGSPGAAKATRGTPPCAR